MILFIPLTSMLFIKKTTVLVKLNELGVYSIYSYIVFIGHFVNGWEQERFLYTGFALQIIFIAYLFKRIIRI